MLMLAIGLRARAAAHALLLASTQAKQTALTAAAAAMRKAVPAILAANAHDLAAAREAGRPASFIDRLMLNEARIEAMAKSLEEIAALPDPVGAMITEWTRPNGLKFAAHPRAARRHRHHLRKPPERHGGCRRAGPEGRQRRDPARRAPKACIRRPRIHACLVAGLRAAELPEAAIQLVPTTDRDAVGQMLAGLDGNLDVIVPRGGKSLVARVQADARVPVFAHLEGICHTYVDRGADLDMAIPLVLNAKMRRTGVCGSTECLLVDSGAHEDYLTPLVKALLDAGCEVRGDDATQKVDARVKAAQPRRLGPRISRRHHRGEGGRRRR